MKALGYIFLAIIIFAAGGWYFTQNQDAITEENTELLGGYPEENGNNVKPQKPASVEGWVDYTNEEYGFSLQYPSDWEAQEALKPQDMDALHEIDFHAKEYEMTRPYFKVQMFDNSDRQSLEDWWVELMAQADKEKAECVAENGDMAPCLTLKDLIEEEKWSTLYSVPTKVIQKFQFDSSGECNYFVYNTYKYKVCYQKMDPNDPNFEENKKITDKIWSTFIFNNMLGSGPVPAPGDLGFEQYVPGKWQSNDDEKSVVIYNEDPNFQNGRGGTMKDIYNGEEMNTGTWMTEGYKLKTMIDGEEYIYTVVFAGSERLELTYQPRGNTLNFTRVEE